MRVYSIYADGKFIGDTDNVGEADAQFLYWFSLGKVAQVTMRIE